jgi:hypothetical protein
VATFDSVATQVTQGNWQGAIRAYHAIPARNLQAKALPVGMDL